LLQDHRQLVPLQSGFIAVMSVLGSVSFDFGGEIQISIWNRNSHSVVDNMYETLKNYFLFLVLKYRPFEKLNFQGGLGVGRIAESGNFVCEIGRRIQSRSRS
jgi:hypothetical protein